MNEEDFALLVQFYIANPEGTRDEANAFLNKGVKETLWRKFVTQSTEKAALLCAAYHNAGLQIGWNRAKDYCATSSDWPDISEVEF